MGGIRRLILAGHLPRKNMTWQDAQPHLEIAEDRYDFPSGGDPSPYLEKAVEGATIHPRAAWFVRIPRLAGGVVDAEEPYVETDTAIEHKRPWDEVRIEGEVKARFLFGSALGIDVVPFAISRVRPVLLPLAGDKHGGVKVLNRERALGQGHPELADWLARVEGEWVARRKRGSKMSIYDRLDFHHLLIDQEPHRKHRVIFNASGTYLTASIISEADMAAEVEGVELNGFIVDNKFYVINADSEGEAHYLAAALNAPAIDKYIKPFQTMGLFGERDIHRRALEYVAIPEYEPSNESHHRLVELGKAARKRALKLLPCLRDAKIGQRRAAIRDGLKDILREIDDHIRKITGITEKKKRSLPRVLKGQTELEWVEI